MAKNNNGKIFVERETFEKNGRTFFSYFIKGVAARMSRLRSFRPTKAAIPCWISCSATKCRQNSF